MGVAIRQEPAEDRADTPPEERLAGLRVLVVEDSFLAAASISRILLDLGCGVVGPVSTVERALAQVEAGLCDAAVLDINLSGQTSEPVADELFGRGTPYFFVTGYASPMLLSSRQRAHLRIHKPITPPELRDALLRSLASDQ